MIAHIEGAPTPILNEEDVERLMLTVREDVGKLLGSYPLPALPRDLGVILEASESSTPTDAGSPATGPVEDTAVGTAGGVTPSVTATSVTPPTNPTGVNNSATIQPAQIFEIEDNHGDETDGVVSGPELKLPVIDIEAANGAGYFDPRATMDTPPLRNGSCTTVNDSELASPTIEESALNAEESAPVDDKGKGTTAQHGAQPAPSVADSVVVTQPAPAVATESTTSHQDTAPEEDPTTANPIPTSPKPPVTPTNTPAASPSTSGHFFQERVAVDTDNPATFAVNSNPATIPAAFAVMNTLSQAERAVRTHNSDGGSFRSSRSSKNKPFTTENPFAVPAKSTPSIPELRRSQSAPMSRAISLPHPLERAKSEHKPSVRFADEVPAPWSPKPRGYLMPMHPEPKPAPPPPEEPESEPEPKEPFQWEKLDDFRSRVEDFASPALKRQQSWGGKDAEKAVEMERRKSEGASRKNKGKGKQRQRQSKRPKDKQQPQPSTRRMVISDIQPRPYKSKHDPPRRLLPTSVRVKNSTPEGAESESSQAQAAQAAQQAQTKPEPVFRDVPSKRPETIAIDPRVAEPTATAEVANQPEPEGVYRPMPLTTSLGGWAEPPRPDYGPRAYAIPFNNGLAFSQARRQRMPVGSRRPLASQEMHARRHGEGRESEETQASTGQDNVGNGGSRGTRPQSQRQREANGEWAEMDPDTERGNGIRWRDVFFGLCGRKRHEGRRETWNVVQH